MAFHKFPRLGDSNFFVLSSYVASVHLILSSYVIFFSQLAFVQKVNGVTLVILLLSIVLLIKR